MGKLVPLHNGLREGDRVRFTGFMGMNELNEGAADDAKNAAPEAAAEAAADGTREVSIAGPYAFTMREVGLGGCSGWYLETKTQLSCFCFSKSVSMCVVVYVEHARCARHCREDTSGYGEFKGGGYVHQQSRPMRCGFKPMAATLDAATVDAAAAAAGGGGG
jgi:hypothetical protein